jgi:hypothetical protein
MLPHLALLTELGTHRAGHTSVSGYACFCWRPRRHLPERLTYTVKVAAIEVAGGAGFPLGNIDISSNEM